MNRRVVKTNDNSSTLYVPELDQHYHSTHGAVQESLHVFIKSGLYQFMGSATPISILEIGFGTGLNPLLTLLEAKAHKLIIDFTSLEKYPLTLNEVKELNYSDILNSFEAKEDLLKLHQAEWEKKVWIDPNFTLRKHQLDFKAYTAEDQFHLIYFDAFSPGSQPNLWTIDIFTNMYNCLLNGGMLVTYCSKGEVRRNMMAAGFEVEKIPGPPGKREMVRAWKR